MGSLNQNMGETEEIEYDCNGHKAEVFGVLTGVTGYHHGEVIEQEEQEQLDGEPVPAGGDMPQRDKRMMVEDAEEEAEHYRGNDKLHELPLEQFPDGITCPLHILLVGHKATDEKEKYEIEVGKNMLERNVPFCMIAIAPDMCIYHKVHAESSE